MTTHFASDVDDVIADFMGGMKRSFELEFGVHVDLGHSWGDDAVKFSQHPLFREAGYEDWWGWLRDRDWIWGGVIPAIPGAIGGLKILHERGHYIELVTSKPDWARPQLNRWLGKWRPYYDHITVVRPGQRKVDYTSADIIVDDKPETCNEFVEAGRQAIFFTPSGEMTDSVKPDVLVARSWPQVLDLMKEITA